MQFGWWYSFFNRWVFPPGKMPEAVTTQMMPLHPGHVWVPAMRQVFDKLPASERPIRCVTPPVDPLVSIWRAERRAEFSALGPLAAVGFGLGLVGTVSARR